MADMLYTCNFTFVGLHEAYAATGEPSTAGWRTSWPISWCGSKWPAKPTPNWTAAGSARSTTEVGPAENCHHHCDMCGPMLMWVIVYPSRVPGTLICTMSFRGWDAGAAACLAVMGRVIDLLKCMPFGLSSLPCTSIPGCIGASIGIPCCVSALLSHLCEPGWVAKQPTKAWLFVDEVLVRNPVWWRNSVW